MSLLNIFKKKPSPAKSSEIKEKIKAPEKKKKPSYTKGHSAEPFGSELRAELLSRSPAEVKEEKIEIPRQKKKIVGAGYGILYSPHITEKATDLVKSNKYVFNVWPRANKSEIKKAVENVYGVEVEAIKIINIPPKRRRLGRFEGWKKGYKKAIVEIKKGQKIEVLPR